MVSVMLSAERIYLTNYMAFRIFLNVVKNIFVLHCCNTLFRDNRKHTFPTGWDEYSVDISPG